MVNETLYQLIVCIAIKKNLIPVFLIKMIGAFDGRVAFAQLYGILRIALHTDLVGVFQVNQHEHFIHNFHYK